jgi:NADPH:quinone reductase-like Zn-dependent oxidoreductase
MRAAQAGSPALSRPIALRASMRAVLLKRWGSVDGLVLADVPVPVPARGEVLVRVHVASVTRGDVVLRKLPPLLARLFGFPRKRVLGTEFAGQIEVVGSAVTEFSVGDRVFGTTTELAQGAYAEYVSVPESAMIVSLPLTVDLEQAAAAPAGGLTAMQLLRRGGLRPGMRVLVYGASGSVGTFAVQLARAGQAHVTAVTSTRNADLVRSLGADDVIVYARQDFTKASDTYDLVLDAVGKISSRQCRPILAEDGSFVSVRSALPADRPQDLRILRDQLATGMVRSVIDRRYALSEIRDAHRYVEEGHKRGNVVIYVAPDRRPAISLAHPGGRRALQQGPDHHDDRDGHHHRHPSHIAWLMTTPPIWPALKSPL